MIIGGSGFGQNNPYERELREAWKVVASRTTIDVLPTADIQADLNKGLPDFRGQTWDVTTAFDILEHLERPTDILRQIPTRRLLVSLPNVLSPFCRRWEKTDLLHLYTFTDYTARKLITGGGWEIEKLYYTFGKWSVVSRYINIVGSLVPAYVGSGIMVHARRP